MINTGNGEFASENSPFAQRNWVWGMSGIGSNVSRDGTSTVIANLPRSNVQMESITNSGPPFAAGSNIQLSGTFSGGIFTGSVLFVGPGTPPPTSTTTTPPPTTTTSSTTTSSTTTSSTTTSSTTTTTSSSTTTTTTSTTTTSTTTTPPPTTSTTTTSTTTTAPP